MLIVRLILFALGAWLVMYTLLSAVRTFVLPRSARDRLSRTTFVLMRHLFELRLKRQTSYLQRDKVMALYAPLSLLALPVNWIIIVLCGYTAMFRAMDNTDWTSAFRLSGSSLFTLGFAVPDSIFDTILVFSEAAIGLTLVALLIAYLPTIYGGFSRREAGVSMLEVRAGSPPSAAELWKRYHRLKRLQLVNDLWAYWELWFTDIEESHSSLAALMFFRSPKPNRSWAIAAGAILDAAALGNAAIDVPHDPQADLCIRAGFLALRHLADFLGMPYNPSPLPTDPISITRVEFEQALDALQESGVPLKPDREQAWKDFAGWRVNYDTLLLAFCSLTMAPPAPWSSDRAPTFHLPPLIQWRL